MDPYHPDLGLPRASLWIDLFVLWSILSSCLLIPLEHIYSAETHPFLHQVLWIGEVFFTFIFVIEYLLRWFVAKNPLRYPFTLYAIIDLVAFLPSLLMFSYGLWSGEGFFLLRAFRGVRILRTLRLLRLIRLLKFLRHGYTLYRLAVEIRIWSGSIIYHYRLGRLARLLLICLMAWVLGANLIHLTERMFAPGSSPYADYWRSYWEVIVVLISGMDASPPVSTPASFEVIILLIAGIVLIAMLTGELVSFVMRSSERSGKLPLKPPGLSLEQHVVILGWNRHLDNVIRQVRAALKGHHYILVVSREADKIPLRDSEIYRRVLALPGDSSREAVLREAGINKAIRVVVLASQRLETAEERDNRTLMHALACVAQSRTVPLTIELQDPESLRYAVALEGAEFVLSRPFGELMICQAVFNPGVTEVYNELLTFSDDSSEIYDVSTPPALIGKSFQQAQLYYLGEDEEPLILIGLDRSPPEEIYSRFWLHPIAGQDLSAQELVLRKGDRLIFIAYEQPSFAQFRQEELWKGKVFARS